MSEVAIHSPGNPSAIANQAPSSMADLVGKNMKLNMDIRNIYQNVVLWLYYMHDMKNAMQALIAAEIINQL